MLFSSFIPHSSMTSTFPYFPFPQICSFGFSSTFRCSPYFLLYFYGFKVIDMHKIVREQHFSYLLSCRISTSFLRKLFQYCDCANFYFFLISSPLFSENLWFQRIHVKICSCREFYVLQYTIFGERKHKFEVRKSFKDI